MDNSEDDIDLPIADDAIPKDAIWLTDAYELVAERFDDQRDRLPKFDEDWSEVLRRSRLNELKVGHDPTVFDAELQEYWQLRKQANLFLRQAIESRAITAYVRDPTAGDVLQLRSQNWIPASWEDDIPPGIWSDFIHEDFESPGPTGTMLSGSLRPVFFIRAQFESWLEEAFGRVQTTSEPQNREPQIRGTRIPAVIDAIRALWGKRPPAGMPVDEIHAQIASWLNAQGRLRDVGRSTLYRALKFNKRL